MSCCQVYGKRSTYRLSFLALCFPLCEPRFTFDDILLREIILDILRFYSIRNRTNDNANDIVIVTKLQAGTFPIKLIMYMYTI